ncbi:unnamed protein product, partial [Sphacelaria rigidula]
MQLKVTCNTSVNSVEFLDIVIHKGTRWLTEGKFDLCTHQKKLNLYGYMPFRSAHPIHTKRGFITGELLRYIATNTDERKFKQLRKRFYFRLLARGYPHTFLLPIFARTRYSERSNRLFKKRESKPVNSVIFSPEFHPIWEQPLAKSQLLEALCDQPPQVQHIVGNIHKPLIALKKTQTLGNILVRA